MPTNTNRLAAETSPYLLQHAHNPVDWHPWGVEAFEKSRRENKPIFLSVGYSTCYWCHVMERQSFENDEIAQQMNDGFVCIKVDREERPDVDQLYMTAVQVLTHHGGWPMSVWLLPDLRPFYGGTYFPPADAHGQPGFPTVLRGIKDAFHHRAQDVETAAGQLTSVLRQLARPPAPAQAMIMDAAWIDGLVARSIDDYDPVHGGFGGAPKFPRQTLLELLLVHNRHQPDERRMAMLRHTLDALANGGIRDHLGGGFHRYSTDARWLVPHFEIMLYDNAMLAWIYAEAFAQTRHEPYAAVVRGVLDFVLREMTSPQGSFYTAFDAEVDALEGARYLWTPEQIGAVLSADEAALFSRVYGLDRGPNFADPHQGVGAPDQNVLYLPEPIAAAAAWLNIPPTDLEQRLQPLRQKLYAARKERKQPLLDDKVITSWNGLMIRAMAYAGQVLAEPRYVDAGARAAEFVLKHHISPQGGLLRTSRQGRAQHDAFLDDYAHMAQGLLALANAQPKSADHWRARAADLAEQIVSRFGDDEAGGFFFTSADADDLIVRQKVATDSPLPSGNAVAAAVFLELGELQRVAGILEAFAQTLAQQAEASSSLLQAAGQYVRQAGPLRISPRGRLAGAPESPLAAARRAVQTDASWISPTEIRVTLQVAPGYHINAHATAATSSLIPTQLDVESAEVIYPPGQPLQTDDRSETIMVYTGAVQLRALFGSPPATPPLLRLTYQACNDRACLPPVTVDVPL